MLKTQGDRNRPNEKRYPMRPVRTFLQQNAIRALLAAEKPLFDLTKGKHAKNRFLSSLDIPFIGSKVKIIKETQTSTFIAKFKDDGSFDDGDFKILNATDLHLDENYEINDKTLQLFINQVRDEKPDLVVFTGDVILSKYQQIDAIQFAQMMERLGVYWAYVFGNHEARAEKEYFKYLIFKSISDYPHCLSKFGRKELFGYGNFIINIMNSETELRESLVLFDSGRGMTATHRQNDKVPADIPDGYDYIKPLQIDWYNGEISQLKKDYGKVESMLYLHIPIKEYEEVFALGDDGEYDFTGKAELLYGGMYESIGCSPYNSGLFAAMKKNGSQAIFAGHDHVNDWAAVYDGILLVYNQCGGYNCYTMGDYNGHHWDEKDWQQGVTVTTVHKDGSIELRQSFNSRYLDK